MAVFKKVRYIASEHSIKRLIERADAYPPTAKQRVEFLASSGYVELDIGKYRYIRNGEVWLPCVQYGDNSYLVKSVLTKDMVQNDMQRRIDKYHDCNTPILH